MKTKQTEHKPQEFKRAIFFTRLKALYTIVEELSFHSTDNDYGYILEAKRKEYEQYFNCKIQLIEVWHCSDLALNNVELEKVIVVDKHKKSDKQLISKY